MIIYFSGTGNSKYLASLISKKLDDEIIDSAKCIKNGDYPQFHSEKPYVFVCPAYAWRMPKVFKEWIEKCEFDGNKKAYFIINCGDSIGAGSNYVEKFSTKKGFCYMGTAEIVMPENYIIMFNAPNKDEDEGIIKAASDKALSLCEKISNDAPFDKIKNTFMDHVYSDFLNPIFYTFYIGARKFYSTDKCISCGKCAESCMLNNISLKDGRPEWGKDCTHCLACISKCPTEAIEYGKNTEGKRRYICPEK